MSGYCHQFYVYILIFSIINKIAVYNMIWRVYISANLSKVSND